MKKSLLVWTVLTTAIGFSSGPASAQLLKNTGARPARPSTTSRRIYFPSIGKNPVKLSGLFYRAPQAKASLLMVAGMQSHSEWHRKTAEFLSKNGITVLAIDRRGTGHSAGERAHAHNRRELFDDVQAGINLLKAEKAPIHILGNCFGARLVIPVGVENGPDVIRSIITLAPSTHMSKVGGDYQPAEKIILGFEHLVDRIVPFWEQRVPTPLDDRAFVSEGPGLAWIQNDPYATRKITTRMMWVARGLRRQMMDGLKKVRVPLLVVLASEDSIVDNESIEEYFDRDVENFTQVTLDSEHAFEFSRAQKEFRELLRDWVLVQEYERRTGKAVPLPYASYRHLFLNR